MYCRYCNQPISMCSCNRDFNQSDKGDYEPTLKSPMPSQSACPYCGGSGNYVERGMGCFKDIESPCPICGK